jgi:hypothetical protein
VHNVLGRRVRGQARQRQQLADALKVRGDVARIRRGRRGRRLRQIDQLRKQLVVEARAHGRRPVHPQAQRLGVARVGAVPHEDHRLGARLLHQAHHTPNRILGVLIEVRGGVGGALERLGQHRRDGAAARLRRCTLAARPAARLGG